MLLEDRISHNLFIGLTHQWAQEEKNGFEDEEGLGRIEQQVADQIVSESKARKIDN